jgi:hypothetical protein
MSDTPSRLQGYLYYLSFVLVWATIAFVASMYLMDYEDKWDSRTNETMWAWSTMQTSHKVAYVTFLIMQFPFGLLFGLITGVYNNGLFAFIINPLFIAWGLHMIYRNSQVAHIKRTLKINYTIWTAMVLTIVIYIALE